MPLAETLVLALAPSITKSLLSLWLQNDTVSSIAGDAIDVILPDAIKNQLQQRQIRRQFEDIGEKVATSLLPMFVADSAFLSESNCIAVAQSVSESLSGSQITAQLLANRNLDPKLLYEHVRHSSNGLIIGFNEHEKALYERVLLGCCSYIIDIASQFPSFSEHALGEILRRENLLVEISQQVLKEIEHIRQSSARNNVEEQTAQFESEYLLAAKRNFDKVELFGVDLLSPVTRRQNLSIAYVSMSLRASRTGEEGADNGTATEGTELYEDVEKEASIMTEAFLAQHTRIAIRGMAGSGKTTLLYWIATRAASHTFGKELQEWNAKVPFIIPLRSIGREFPAPESFPKFVSSSIAGMMPEQWVHNRLEDGRAIVLIDGVDEISERQDLFNWINDLVGSFPNSIYIITSRPTALEEGAFAELGFTDAEMLPMTYEDISVFIDHWHKAIAENLTYPEDIDGLAQNLKQVVKSSPSIQALATNPLLCAMMCALHRDRFKQLPTDRIELYEACCAMLIEKRDIERGILIEKYPKLHYRQKRVLLNDLAYYLLKNGWSEVTVPRAVERLKTTLSTLTGFGSQLNARNVLQMLLERSGLVREPVSGHLDFAHRTFQEFLAAQEAVDQGDIGLLLEKSEDDQWREVIILAAGLAGKEARKELIQGLLDKGDIEPKRQHQMHLLAVACLETITDIDTQITTSIDKRIQKLIPPTNMTEAKALASAGELAVSQLAKCYNRRAAESAASVRALSLIGTKSALDALENFREDKRQTVVSELIRAWDFFDKAEYGSRIVSHLELREYRATSLSVLQYLRRVPTIIISQDPDEAYDPHLLLLVKQVESLTLFLPDKTDLSFMDGFDALQDLTLSWVGNENIDWLARIRQLRQLRLDFVSPTVDLSVLAQIPHLEVLTIMSDGNSDVRRFGPLARLKHLTVMTLNLNDTLDLSGINELPMLRSLHLDGFNRLEGIHLLRTMNKLDNLSFSCELGQEDLKQIPSSSALALLQIHELTEISLLINATQTDSLFCRSCENLTDLSGLERWKDLEMARFLNCPAIDVHTLPPNFKPVTPRNGGYYLLRTRRKNSSDRKQS